MNWVKTDTAETFDAGANRGPLPAPVAAAPFVAAPRALPQGLTFSGIMAIGKERLAVINGVAFAAGDQKTIKLRDQPALVRCREVHESEITVEVRGAALTLEKGEEKLLP